MSMSKIYADSYKVDAQTAETKEEKREKTLEERSRWKQLSERRKLGLLLKEEKSRVEKLKRKNLQLEEENRRLKAAIALRSGKA